MKIEILQKALKIGLLKGVKSIFFFPQFPPLGNRKGIEKLDSIILSNKDIEDILKLTLTEWQRERLKREKEIDYSYEIKNGIRFRIAAFYRAGQVGIVARPIPTKIPSFDQLGIPPIVKEFTELKHGIVLITGPTGSGKSTTLASLIDIINQNKSLHIITIEDPIEFIYERKKSIVSQREIGSDTISYKEALKSILREDPDVILIGEIRDKESMKSALELAETGHLVFSTLHTINVIQTINRIIDFFPEHEKHQVRNQISNVLKGVVCQRLLRKKTEDGFVCACEVLKMNSSIGNLIKEGRVHQIYSIADSMKKHSIISMEDASLKLYREGVVNLSEVIEHITDTKKIDPIIKEMEFKQNKAHRYRKEIVETHKKPINYKLEVTPKSLSYLDASGMIIETSDGILFKDTGQSKGEFHFIGDYTMLNGKKPTFPLKNFFNFSYIIRDVRRKKPLYRFQLKVVENMKMTVDFPKTPYEMFFDGQWHSVSIPIPKIYENIVVKYYLMFFDKDINVVEFSNIYFS